MGAACHSDSTVTSDIPAGQPIQSQAGNISVRATSSNPFYDLDWNHFNESDLLSKYQFHSKYKDQFLGDCSVIQDQTTGDLYLCKEL